MNDARKGHGLEEAWLRGLYRPGKEVPQIDLWDQEQMRAGWGDEHSFGRTRD